LIEGALVLQLGGNDGEERKEGKEAEARGKGGKTSFSTTAIKAPEKVVRFQHSLLKAGSRDSFCQPHVLLEIGPLV